MEKRITITTNDPHHANAALTMKAVVEPEIGGSDSQVVFDHVPVGREVAKEIVLTVRAAKSIRILSAVSKNPDIMAKLEPVPGDKRWKLIAVRKANAKPGYFFGQIIVKTNSRLTPEFPIYVRGMTASPKTPGKR